MKTHGLAQPLVVLVAMIIRPTIFLELKLINGRSKRKISLGKFWIRIGLALLPPINLLPLLVELLLFVAYLQNDWTDKERRRGELNGSPKSLVDRRGDFQKLCHDRTLSIPPNQMPIESLATHNRLRSATRVFFLQTSFLVGTLSGV